MPVNLRLSKNEEKLTRERCIEINKIFVNSGFAPLRDSELLHKVLERTLPNVKADSKGGIYIDL